MLEEVILDYIGGREIKRIFLIRSGGFSPKQIANLNEKFKMSESDLVVRFNTCPSSQMLLFGGRTDVRFCRGLIGKRPGQFFGKNLVLNGNNPYFRENGLLLLEKGRMNQRQFTKMKEINGLSRQHVFPDRMHYLDLSVRTGLFSEKGCPSKDASIGFKAFCVLRKIFPDANIHCVGFTFKHNHSGHSGDFERRVVLKLGGKPE